MTDAHVEVAQQSKARRKDDFLIAFSPVIAEATSTAYKGATNEVQQKLRRVVEVWRQRAIFDLPIQEAIESRIDGTWTVCHIIASWMPLFKGTLLTHLQSLTRFVELARKDFLTAVAYSLEGAEAYPASSSRLSHLSKL